jgi:hypothetical protein
MTLLKRKRVLAAKIETTPGTADFPLAADAAFNVYNMIAQQEIEVESREAQGGFGMLNSVLGGYKGRITFSVDASWDGTATEPSWADTFLPACGWVKSGQVFTPRTEVTGSNVKTLTIAIYQDGMAKYLKGAAGTFQMVCPTGRTAFFNFDFQGIWIAPNDVGIVAPTYPAAKGMRYANSTTTWDGVALCLENITLDSGNTVTLKECATDVSGYDYALVTNRVVTVSGNPEAKLVGTQNRFDQYLTTTEAVLTWGLDGPTNSVLTMSAPKAQIIDIQEGDRNMLVTDEITWQCNRNGSNIDQEISLTLTAAT